jgi:hypothetical protein
MYLPSHLCDFAYKIDYYVNLMQVPTQVRFQWMSGAVSLVSKCVAHKASSLSSTSFRGLLLFVSMWRDDVSELRPPTVLSVSWKYNSTPYYRSGCP